MPRALRFTLWSVGTLALVLGIGLFWVDSQLRAEPLGARVKALLTDAKIQGGIVKIEAELDGRFTAEGIDLTLPSSHCVALLCFASHCFALLCIALLCFALLCSALL